MTKRLGCSHPKRCSKHAWLALLFVMNSSWGLNQKSAFWLPLTLQGKYHGHMYQLEPQLRFIEGNTTFDNSLIYAAIGKQLTSWSFWLGTMYGYADQDTKPDFREIRLWQQAAWTSITSPHQISIRSRLEQRKGINFPQIANRFRGRLQISWPYRPTITLYASNEVFINLNAVPWIQTKTLDQNRIYFGAEHQVSSTLKVQLGYMQQLVFTAKRQAFNIVRLALLFNLDAS